MCSCPAQALCPALWRLADPALGSKGRIRSWLQGSSRAPWLSTAARQPPWLSSCPCDVLLLPMAPALLHPHWRSRQEAKMKRLGIASSPDSPDQGVYLYRISGFHLLVPLHCECPRTPLPTLCKVSGARHWVELKGEGKGNLFCLSQGLGGLGRTNQF